MGTADGLFAAYEAIAALMTRMRAAAHDGDWNTVIAMQDRYRELVDRLHPMDAATTLDDGQRARKHDLLRHILAADADIRDLAAPRLARLAAQAASQRTARALQQTYSGSPPRT